MLQQVDQDWTNALVSDSKEALEAYLQKYPNTPHKNEIWNKIDSIDWQLAQRDNSVDAYQAYLDAHADGAHIEEAEIAMRNQEQCGTARREADGKRSLPTVLPEHQLTQ